MKLRLGFQGCAREPEVQAALAAGAWPLGCDAGVRAHVVGCRACTELVRVRQALRRAAETGFAARMGVAASSPGTLWWRAQLRRRYEALERSTRPVAWAETLGLTVVLAALLGLLAWQWSPLLRWEHAAWAVGTALPLSSIWTLLLSASAALAAGAAAVLWFTGRG